jgi:hypothetical protein
MRCFLRLLLSCALSLGASAAAFACSVSPNAGNPDNVGAVAPKPIHSMVTTPRAPRPITFDSPRDGGTDALDGAVLDAGAQADTASSPSSDAGQAIATAQLDAVVASFNASVELECACLWSAPGYEYDSESTCIAVGRLDQASATCVRAQLHDALVEVLDCKLDAERVFRSCLADGCSEATALDCVETWAASDEACDPGLAAAVYDACLASDA